MIPIVTLDNKGQVNGQQAFNDYLTPQEELNRIMLATYYNAQFMLTNDMNGVATIIGKGNYTAEQLANMKKAAETMYLAVMAAVEAFKTAVEAE